MIGATIVLKTMIKGSNTYETLSKINITIPNNTNALSANIRSLPPKIA